MFTVAIKRQLTKSLNVYANWALTDNGPAAHYDLAAGGRAVTADCHDASDSAGGLVASNPHCWTGGKLMGAFSRDELEALGLAARRGCIEIGIAASQFLKAHAGSIESRDDAAFQISEETRAGVLRVWFWPSV